MDADFIRMSCRSASDIGIVDPESAPNPAALHTTGRQHGSTAARQHGSTESVGFFYTETTRNEFAILSV